MGYFYAFLMCLLWAHAHSQNVIHIKDLSPFKDPSFTWKIVGSITANLEKPNVFNVSDGTGILVNAPDKKNKGADLFKKRNLARPATEPSRPNPSGKVWNVSFTPRCHVGLFMFDPFRISYHLRMVTNPFTNPSDVFVLRSIV